MSVNRRTPDDIDRELSRNAPIHFGGLRVPPPQQYRLIPGVLEFRGRRRLSRIRVQRADLRARPSSSAR